MIREERNMTAERLNSQLQTALGKEPADLYIKNVKIVDVYTETIYDGSVLIKEGKIVNINPGFLPEAASVLDAEGMYMVPGFIEPSMHMDCSLAMPNALAEGFVPWGTTTVVAEVNDIAGHYGPQAVAAVKAYFKDADKLPYRLLGLAPGKCVTKDTTLELLEWGELAGQGESFGYTTLAANPDTLEKDVNIKRKNLFLNGHVDPFANTDQIGAFCVCGARNDHEAWSYEAVIERLRRGVAPQILFSQGTNQLKYMIQEVVINHHLPTENLLFSADNGYIDDMVNTGLLGYLVETSIQLGLEPMTAIKMASYNVARNLGLDQVLGSITPGRYADFMLLPQLTKIQPKYVFKAGRLVAQDGHLTEHVEIDYSFFREPVVAGLEDFRMEQLYAAYQTEDQDRSVQDVLVVKSKDVKGSSKAQYVDGSFIDHFSLPVEQGHTCSDPEQDAVKLVFVERYPKDPAKRIIIPYYVKGFNLKEGAIAMTQLMGINGILAMGMTEEDIYTAIQEVDRHAGAIVVAKGNTVDGVLDLPYAGMNSDLRGRQIADILNNMTQIVRDRGCDMTELWLKIWVLGSTVKKYPIFDV